ncbi:protein tramtrack, beta isoform isoform X2 [Chrysoperla carnea]|uniref:protein tramtrack, beta isoform isoform X2 n=1 Tax=Chrysoperla carnea TaxID=189513 RepID=UPI001D06ED3F|nr:protein tramtrack, beta isoform isoform X2 [Chrysoperla carnea]
MLNMVAPQQFCVRWNSYHSNLQNAFPKLLTSEHFVDVTLACDNGLIKCHKVVLSACSNYFENILIQNPCQHPTIVLKDMKCREVQSLVDFMYKGEVNVTQEELPHLLKAAEGLQIRGLSGSEQCLSQMNILCQSPTKPQCPPLAPVTPHSGQIPTAAIPNVETATASSITPTSSASNNDHKLMNHIKIETEIQKENIDVNRETKIKSDTTVSVNGDHENKNEDSQDGFESDDKAKSESTIKEEEMNYNDEDLEMDYLDGMEYDGNEANGPGTSDNQSQSSDYNPAANVSCLYTKRIRRSETELRQAADCITRGQTFQNVSDQFNIPISTIRFFMARKGILPRRKRGRGSSANVISSGGFHSNALSGGDRSDWNGL